MLETFFAWFRKYESLAIWLEGIALVAIFILDWKNRTDQRKDREGQHRETLARLEQRQREWLRDNRKQEWRELISALSRNARYILDNSFGLISGEQEKRIVQANADARSVIEDRIFIAPQVQSGNILEQWQLFAVEEDFSRMVDHWNHLHEDLVAAAHKDLGMAP
jgi:hypothetical protein